MNPDVEVKCAHCLLRHGDKFLVLHHEKHGVTDVGGKLEGGEDADACIQREIREEICGGDEIKLEALLSVGEWGQEHYIAACKSVFRILSCGERPEIDIGHEAAHKKYEWVTLSWLLRNRLGKADATVPKFNYRLRLALKLVPAPRPVHAAGPSQRPLAEGGMRLEPSLPGRVIALQERFNEERRDVFVALAIPLREDPAENRRAHDCVSAMRYMQDGVYTDMGMGRLQCGGGEDSPTGPLQCRMKNVVKGTICAGVYHDLDITNAQPTLLLQALQHHKLPHGAMQTFVRDRDTVPSGVFPVLMRATGKGKDALKGLVFKALYGGRPETWCREHGVDIAKIAEFVALTANMKTELAPLLDLHPGYRAEAERRQAADPGRWPNVDGCALSLLAQTCEKHCLLAMYDALTDLGYEVGALVHDGLHVKSTQSARQCGKLAPADVERVQQRVRESTGFAVALAIKTFRVHPRVAAAHVMLDQVDGGEFVLRQGVSKDWVVDGGSQFYRQAGTHCWYTNSDRATKDRIRCDLLNRVHECDVLLRKADGGLQAQTKDIRPASDLREYVYNNPDRRPGFRARLWDSNIGKLCYSNGWYEFATGVFHAWGAEGTPETLVVIDRPFPAEKLMLLRALRERGLLDGGSGQRSAAESGLLAELRDLQARITEQIFCGQSEMANCFYQMLSRAMAGMQQDKVWGMALGERNCGKGVLMQLMEAAFGPYVESGLPASKLLKTCVDADPIKAQAWMIPAEKRRLVFTSELDVDSEGKTRLDGTMIKKFASGGDAHQARNNYCDAHCFKIQATLVLLANDTPPVEPSDAKKTGVFFQFPSEFLQAGDPRLGKRQKTGKGHSRYHTADDEIKTYCRQHLVDAWTLTILYLQWRPHKVAVPAEMEDETREFREEASEEATFMALFAFGAHGCFVSVDNINGCKRKAGLTCSPFRYKRWLQKRGCTKRKVEGKWVWDGMEVAERVAEAGVI